MALKLNSSSRRRRRADPFCEINVTPMVDVMLVLLVIFMVAAPMMTTGVTVDLPQSKSSAIPGQDEPLSVSVTADGRIFIQKTQVPLKGLQNKLKAIAGQKKDTRIFVRGDKNIDYGRVMQVVGEINAAGFNKVALITEAGAAAEGRDK
ncbi:MAG: protein TolR [Pseudomonadota bacterium]|nr:protein TolR [Pseudomonadota bacterium]